MHIDNRPVATPPPAPATRATGAGAQRAVSGYPQERRRRDRRHGRGGGRRATDDPAAGGQVRIETPKARPMPTAAEIAAEQWLLTHHPR